MSVPTPLTTDSLAAEMDTYPIAPEALIWVGSKTVRPGWWLVVLRLGASGSAMFWSWDFRPARSLSVIVCPMAWVRWSAAGALVRETFLMADLASAVLHMRRRKSMVDSPLLRPVCSRRRKQKRSHPCATLV